MTAFRDDIMHSKEEFNNETGNQYTVDDQVSVEELNYNIENGLYAARTATEAKEIAEEAKEVSGNFVSYETQTPTDAQKQQARDNIGAVAKVTNPTNNHLASLDSEGNIKDSGLDAIALENSINSKQNNVIDSVGNIDWADFRPFLNDNLPFDGFGGSLGTYACRLDASADTSGLISSLGFSGTYYAEFNIWYIGETDPNNPSGTPIGMIIKISDSSASTSISPLPYAEANVLIYSQGGANISSLFTKTRPNQATKSEVNSLSMCPNDGSGLVVQSTAPSSTTHYFTAPTNGIAYVRICCSQDGTLAFHHRGSTNTDIGFNTQVLNTSNGRLYNATFVMKQGQKLYCHENTAEYAWGGVVFVKAENLAI